MSASLILQLAKQKHISLFIGQWAAPFLLFGIYNKLVKQRGTTKLTKRKNYYIPYILKKITSVVFFNALCRLYNYYTCYPIRL